MNTTSARGAAPAGIPIITPAEAASLVREGRAVIVDVRERDEWEEAHIPQALHLPLGQIAQRLGEVPRDRKVILQCHSGARSMRAAELLVEAGFTDVANLTGGILRWANEEMPLEA